MPDASIVVKATDRYSEAMKKMASVTKSFSKDVDALEDTLYALNKNKITLKMDLSKAKSELKAAEKQFDLTHSAADGLKLELAQANYSPIFTQSIRLPGLTADHSGVPQWGQV